MGILTVTHLRGGQRDIWWFEAVCLPFSGTEGPPKGSPGSPTALNGQTSVPWEVEIRYSTMEWFYYGHTERYSLERWTKEHDLRHFKMRPGISIRGIAHLLVHLSVRPLVRPSVRPSVRPLVGRSVTTFFQRANLDEKSMVIIPILPPPLPLPLPPLPPPLPPPPPPPILSLPPLPLNIRVNRGGWGRGRGWRRKRWALCQSEMTKKSIFLTFCGGGGGVAGTLETNRRALKLKV